MGLGVLEARARRVKSFHLSVAGSVLLAGVDGHDTPSVLSYQLAP